MKFRVSNKEIHELFRKNGSDLNTLPNFITLEGEAVEECCENGNFGEKHDCMKSPPHRVRR